ncbi:hypothetical protein, partial [Acidisphaera sp. L21]|uniref:hypothetical protein n=1 Tax=Acidisphaera sp. L21 TaxID=1641851 RepID=UPI001C207520
MAALVVLLVHGSGLFLLQGVRPVAELDPPSEAILLDLAPAPPEATPAPPAPAAAATPPPPAPTP